MTDEERFLRSVCPYCGSNQHGVVRQGRDILFDKGEVFRALACTSCGGWFTDGSQFPSARRYYELSYPSAYYERSSGGRAGDRGSNPFLGAILARQRGLRPGSRVLDVGCGNGGFPNYLRELGLDAEGVEISALASEYARTHYGLRVTTGTLEDLPASSSYEAITMVGTIEHLLNPARTLLAVAQRLVAGGLFVFDFPVIDCLESKLARERWWGLDLPRHTVHLTYARAAQLARAAGLSVAGAFPIHKTYFHYGYLSPPSEHGFARWSLPGIGVQLMAALFIATGRSPLGVLVCRKSDVVTAKE